MRASLLVTSALLLIGAAIGIAGYIFFRETFQKSRLERAGDKISESASDLKDQVSDKIDLDTNEIRDELARTGKVIRIGVD